ncbi:MAG: ATP-binding protein [Oligoflexales bacterium]
MALKERPEERIIVLAPMGQDALVTSKVLREAELSCTICNDSEDLFNELRNGVGALLVTEEALNSNTITNLQEFLETQPPWSDIPIVLSTIKGSLADGSVHVLRFLETFRNLTILERPIWMATFHSVIKTALSERQRQYAMRGILLREKQLRSEAEEANRSKDQFLATLSHELRTPLNAILGFSELLAYEEQGTKEFDEALAIIVRNARAQVDLINDLLDVSRIIAGKLSLDKKPVNMVSVVQDTIGSCQIAARSKSVSIQVVSNVYSVSTLGDSTRLQQVVWNLLTNAIKFSRSGEQITVEMNRVANTFNLVVKDLGEGIEPKFLPFVFDKFRQQDGTFARRFGGLGLGLSIVKHLVEAHGGTVKAESEGKGKGATFTVSLPLTEEISEVTNASELRSIAYSGAKNIEKGTVRVLVVEDEEDSRRLITSVLNRAGIHVVDVDSAEKARLALTQAEFDAVVCDIGMPGEDGFRFIQSVRAAEKLKGSTLPAAAVTGYVSEEDKARALAAGFNLHLPKPIYPQDVLRAVDKLLSLQKKSSHLGIDDSLH